MGGIDSLPAGLFRTLLDLWTMIRYSYVLVYEFFIGQIVSIPGLGDVNVASILFGSGLTLYFIYTLVKWIVPV